MAGSIVQSMIAPGKFPLVAGRPTSFEQPIGSSILHFPSVPKRRGHFVILCSKKKKRHYKGGYPFRLMGPLPDPPTLQEYLVSCEEHRLLRDSASQEVTSVEARALVKTDQSIDVWGF